MKVSLVFLLCRGQMGVVGKRAKKEKKEEKFHGCSSTFFFELPFNSCLT
jgi:hypothetical protein